MTVGITNKTGACASTSASRASGVLLALLLVLFLFYFPSLLFAAEDQADIVDQQRLFLDQAMHNIDLEREQLEAEKKAKAEERLKFQKKRTERRLVEQLKGLSGTLSGLPELPSFSGKFESQGIDPRLATQSNDYQKDWELSLENEALGCSVAPYQPGLLVDGMQYLRNL